jgi:4-diphosphocytidyl-2-C-methyl-D-erythritol kinase
MVSFPHAKINLGLQVIRKRPDGFHDLETCFYPIPWTDILEIIPVKEFQFSSSGLPIDGDATHNLCVKAYNLLRKDFEIPPVLIHLHKVIPMGAGLGGGSSDAAFTLRQINQSFDLKIPSAKLAEYAAVLGSDCAFFISDEPKFGTGRGDVLTPISVSLKGKFIVVVKPDIHVSTADAFAGIKPKESAGSLKDFLETNPVSEWKKFLKNDFEETVFKKYPQIENVKQKLYSLGAVYASMSGSGSAVFGLFDKPVNLSNEFSPRSLFQTNLI